MATYAVSTMAELESALGKAGSGDEIRLAGGDYGKLSLYGVSFNGDVTITSSDPDDPASFSGMNLSNVSNLSFDGVVFDYEYNGEANSSYSPFVISGSSGITIENSVFSGDTASGQSEILNGYGYGMGLRVIGSDNITLDGSEFSGFYKGAMFQDVENLVVTNNEVYNIRSDGMNFVEAQNVLIEGNYFHDFKGSAESGDHSDLIQFFKAGTDEASSNIQILNNTFDIGEGSWSQTIYLGDSGIYDRSLAYQDVLIKGNEIYGAHHNGITVGLADGLTIQDNFVLPVDANENDAKNALIDGNVTIPKIIVASSSKNVDITGNTTYRIGGYDGQSDWSVGNNIILSQDQNLLDALKSEYEKSGVTWDGGSSTVKLPATTDDGFDGGETGGGTGDPVQEETTGTPKDLHLYLVDSKTDEVIRELSSIDEVSASELSGGVYNLAAVYDGDSAASVQFWLNGEWQSTEGLEPYAMFKDDGGDYLDRALPADGTMENLEVRVFSGAGGGGTMLYSEAFELSYDNPAEDGAEEPEGEGDADVTTPEEETPVINEDETVDDHSDTEGAGEGVEETPVEETPDEAETPVINDDVTDDAGSGETDDTETPSEPSTDGESPEGEPATDESAEEEEPASKGKGKGASKKDDDSGHVFSKIFSALFGFLGGGDDDDDESDETEVTVKSSKTTHTRHTLEVTIDEVVPVSESEEDSPDDVFAAEDEEEDELIAA